nr:hypothetical protein [uncultured Rhodoferax sp.]
MKTIAVVLLSLALTGCATQKIAPVTVSGKTVVFQGLIYAATVDEFVQAVEQHDAKRVLIASGGGHVASALRMARVIHDRGMDVEVFGLCFSSCANYIFPAGKNKSITSLGIVGWHGNIQHLLHLHRTGKAPITGSFLEEATTLAAQEAEFYKTIGLDPFVTWFGKLPPYNVRDTYLLAPNDMARFGIRDVAVRADYVQTDLAPYNAGGVEKVRFVEVQWDSLRLPESVAP